jgi:hypothetical protein
MFDYDPSYTVLGGILTTALVMSFIVVIAYIKGTHDGRRLYARKLEDRIRNANIMKGLSGGGWPTGPASPAGGAAPTSTAPNPPNRKRLGRRRPGPHKRP